MADPTPPRVTPEYLKQLAEDSDRRTERLEELADASRLRAALYPAPEPPPAGRPRRFSRHPVPTVTMHRTRPAPCRRCRALPGGHDVRHRAHPVPALAMQRTLHARAVRTTVPATGGTVVRPRSTRRAHRW